MLNVRVQHSKGYGQGPSLRGSEVGSCFVGGLIWCCNGLIRIPNQGPILRDLRICLEMLLLAVSSSVALEAFNVIFIEPGSCFKYKPTWVSRPMLEKSLNHPSTLITCTRRGPGTNTRRATEFLRNSLQNPDIRRLGSVSDV